MSILNALTNATANYGDDVVRAAANNYGDDLVNAAYNGIRKYKIANPAGVDLFGTQDFDYAKLMRDNEKAISKTVGDDALKSLRDNVRGMLKMYNNQYDDDLARATAYLQGDMSNPIARQSQNYVKPGTKIFRAENSPYGISWTTDRNVAMQARNNDATKILEHILQPDDKYIAPQFTELYNEFVTPQSEILFNWDKML